MKEIFDSICLTITSWVLFLTFVYNIKSILGINDSHWSLYVISTLAVIAAGWIVWKLQNHVNEP